MTVLELGPPHGSHLRLVSSSGPRRRDGRYRTAATLGLDARRIHRGALAHALAAGVRIDADALRVVLAAKQLRQTGPISYFTTESVWQLMFCDIAAWCRTRRLEMPSGCVAAIGAVLEFLDQDDSFAEGSDHVDDLWLAVDECSGGLFDHRHAGSFPLR